VEKTTDDAQKFYNGKVEELGTNVKELENIVNGKANNLRVVEEVLRQKVLAGPQGGQGGGEGGWGLMIEGWGCFCGGVKMRLDGWLRETTGVCPAWWKNDSGQLSGTVSAALETYSARPSRRTQPEAVERAERRAQHPRNEVVETEDRPDRVGATQDSMRQRLVVGKRARPCAQYNCWAVVALQM